MVSVPFSRAGEATRTGTEHYSYYYVYRALAPLLQRWGCIQEVTQPESRLDYALRRARQAGQEPVHLSFLPLHHAYLTSEAPNVAFPFWEFPDIPQESLEFSSRHHWGRIAERLDLILTASTFTRDGSVKERKCTVAGFTVAAMSMNRRSKPPRGSCSSRTSRTSAISEL